MEWRREQILVIDDDLGRSAASALDRPAFQRLVANVGLGHVGLVLGIEVSRLARSCRDWHQLLEMCALFDTLIGDADGIYDLSTYDDRLLLGIKGTMSEAELHILKARRSEIRSIVEMQLERVKRTAHGQGVELTIDGSLVDHLAAAGFRPEFGARELRRLIRSELETQLARAMLANEVQEGDRVLARWDSEQQKVVLEPQAKVNGDSKAGATAPDEHRNAVEIDRDVQRGSGNDSRTAAE